MENNILNLLTSGARGVRDVGQAIVQPAVNYGQFVGEAGAQGLRYILDPLFRKAINNPESLTPEEIDVVNRIGGTERQTFFVDPERLATRGDIAQTGLKRTVGAASYAVPSLGATLPAAVARGALVGGGMGFASDEENLLNVGDVARGAATGGVTAGALYGLGKLLGRVRRPSPQPAQAVADQRRVMPLERQAPPPPPQDTGFAQTALERGKQIRATQEPLFVGESQKAIQARTEAQLRGTVAQKIQRAVKSLSDKAARYRLPIESDQSIQALTKQAKSIAFENDVPFRDALDDVLTRNNFNIDQVSKVNHRLAGRGLLADIENAYTNGDTNLLRELSNKVGELGKLPGNPYSGYENFVKNLLKRFAKQ